MSESVRSPSNTKIYVPSQVQWYLFYGWDIEKLWWTLLQPFLQPSLEHPSSSLLSFRRTAGAIVGSADWIWAINEKTLQYVWSLSTISEQYSSSLLSSISPPPSPHATANSLTSVVLPSILKSSSWEDMSSSIEERCFSSSIDYSWDYLIVWGFRLRNVGRRCVDCWRPFWTYY